MIVVWKGMFVVLNLHEVVLHAEIMDHLLQLVQLQAVNCVSVQVGDAEGDSDNDGDKVAGKTCQTAMRPGPAKVMEARPLFMLLTLKLLKWWLHLLSFMGFSTREMAR